MSHYIRCPQCREDTLDVDTLRCECGHNEPLPPRDDAEEAPATRQEKSAHTPGPWTVSSLDSVIVSRGAQDGPQQPLAFVYAPACASPLLDQARADARLIAAAPELFAALQAAQKRLEQIDDNCAPAVAVRLQIGDALAKAAPRD